jgi:acetyl esterase/lipase
MSTTDNCCRPRVRQVLEGVQRSPIDKPDVKIEDLTIAGGPHGHIAVRRIRPAGSTATLPVILYVHGAGCPPRCRRLGEQALSALAA